MYLILKVYHVSKIRRQHEPKKKERKVGRTKAQVNSSVKEKEKTLNEIRERKKKETQK